VAKLQPGANKMIKRVIILTLLIATFGVPSAEAHEFIQEPSEGGFTNQGGTQTFTTNVATITCTSAKGTGSEHGSKAEELAIAYNQYESCKGPGKVATVSEGLYAYHANGQMTFDNTIKIFLEGEDSSTCEITISPTGNKELKSVTFTNNSPGLTFKENIQGISYEVKDKTVGGICCPSNGEKAANGEIKGESKTETYSAKECIFTPLDEEWFQPNCTEKMGVGVDLYKKRGSYTALKWS
jgi:hypothetical protein